MPRKGYKKTPEHKAKAVANLKNFFFKEGADERRHMTGSPHTHETRLKMSRTRMGKPLKANPVTPPLVRARVTTQAKWWRRLVLELDGYACADCGEAQGRLEVHHLKPFRWFPALRYEISNGKVVCQSCHKENHGHKDHTKNRVLSDVPSSR